MRKRQIGLATVEFALIGLLFFIILFGVIEFGRLLFTWNTLAEATRRGARLAAVCPVSHASIARVTVFNNPGTAGDSPILPGLSTANVQVQYLQNDGITDWGGIFANIRYVRVSIRQDNINRYQHQLIIPVVGTTITAPPFAATLPRESLGAVPNPDNPAGGTTQCPGA